MSLTYPTRAFRSLRPGTERYPRVETRVSQAELAALRPLITDYPERAALNKDFPQPGRRGGSRPPREAVAPTTVYPPTHGPYTPPPIEEIPGEGQTFRFEAFVAAGTATVLVSQPLVRPYTIKHVNARHGSGANVDVGIEIFTGQDSSNTGATVTSFFNVVGDPLFDPRGFQGAFDPQGTFIDLYPNKKITTIPGFIKVGFRNNTAANSDMMVTIDVEIL